MEPPDLGGRGAGTGAGQDSVFNVVREAGDLSAGVYNDHGEMLAQAVTGTPGHVNAMADAVAHFIRRIGRQNMFDGDIYITNDPWEGQATNMTLPLSRHLFTKVS